jgi:ABC-2 type transport system ATP-binding protein
LIGKNGSGKTTMLRLITGLYLPTSGECFTLGRRTPDLDTAELARLGVVYQRGNLVGWMTVTEMVRYVASFYDNWDAALEARLMQELELHPDVVVSTLSPGNTQRLSLLLAVCHRPQLLLLDEPFSDMDPTGREVVLPLLLDLMRESETTIVVSSHLLFDIERIVDRVICLHAGVCVADNTLDELKESYAEWTVRSLNGSLPAHFAEPFVLSSEGDGRQARLVVRDGTQHLAGFRSQYNVEVERRALNLARIFPVLTGDRSTAGSSAPERSSE